jgi:hypothetical protein
MAKKLAIAVNGGGMLESKLLNEVFDVYDPNYGKMADIINNPNPNSEVYTEEHHIIPQFFYRMNNIQIDNSPVNLVRLSLKNHFLVHYYAAKCAKEKYKSRLWFSVIRTLGNFKIKGWEEQIDSISEKIAEIKLEANKGHSRLMTPEARRHLSELNKGERHPKYGTHHSEHTKMLISISQKGKIIPIEERIRISNALKGNVHHTDREKELSRKASIAFIKPAKEAYQKYKSGGGELRWNQFQKEFARGELK